MVTRILITGRVHVLAAALVVLSSLAAPAAAQEPGQGIPAPRLGPVTMVGSFWTDVRPDGLTTCGCTTDRVAVRRVRIGATGKFSPKWTWRADMEFTGNPRLAVAFIGYRPSDQLDIRVGQLAPQIGLERSLSTLDMEVIDRALPTSRLTYGFVPGVFVRNVKPWRGWVRYVASINTGGRANAWDDNAAKDVTGRIEISPPVLRGVAFGASGATGRQADGERTRTGLDVSYEHRAFRVGTEVLREQYDGRPDRGGIIATAAYRISPHEAHAPLYRVDVAARFSVFDDPRLARPATATSAAVPRTTRDLQLGVAYHLNPSVKFLGDVVFAVDQRATPRTRGLTRLQITF